VTVPAGAGNTLVTRGFAGTWTDLDPVDLPPAAAVFCGSHLDALRALWASLQEGPGELLIAARNRSEPELDAALHEAGLAIVHLDGERLSLDPAPELGPSTPGRIWLLTSGSTGRPKHVAHTLASLTTVGGDQPDRTWLCPYTPGSYAWWQVVTLALANPGQNVVFIEPDELSDWAQIAVRNGVTSISGTPTFWRQSLMHSGETVRGLDLGQATLGGEPVDQRIIDQCGISHLPAHPKEGL